MLMTASVGSLVLLQDAYSCIGYGNGGEDVEEIKKSNWGGRRPGAGRPALPGAGLRRGRSIRATDEEWKVIRRLAKLLKDGGAKAEKLKKLAEEE